MLRKLLTFGCLLISGLCVYAQRSGSDVLTFEATEWNDHAVVSTNRLESHTNVVAFANENDIEKGNYRRSPYYISLNGTWNLKIFDTPSIENLTIDSKHFSVSDWQSGQVPSLHLEDRGRIMKIPAVSNLLLDTKGNTVATYCKEFEAYKTWSNYAVWLQLQARTAYYVWVNNQFVGYAENSRVPSTFDISKYLKFGKTNTLIVQTISLSDGALMETNLDNSVNGLCGDVALLLKPETHVGDFSLIPTYNADTKIGMIDLDVDLESLSGKGRYYLEVELWDPKGKEFDKMGKWVAFDKRKSVSLHLNRDFTHVDVWNDVTPNLYTAVLRVRNENLEVVETVGTRFGFRSVNYKDGALCVNGEKIKLKGIVFDGLQNTSKDVLRKELSKVKELNMNAVWMSAFSTNEDVFYELCDELGLYVVCDADLSPYASQKQVLATDEDYSLMFTSRVHDIYSNYKNHTSIVAWSLGQSEDNGLCMEQAYSHLKSLEKHRPVLYPGAHYAENTDIVTLKEQTPEMLRQYVQKNNKRSLLLLNFGIINGNSLGGLSAMWNAVNSNEKFQGGFLYSWDNLYQDSQLLPCADEIKSMFKDIDVSIIKTTPDAGEFMISNHSNNLLPSHYKVEYCIYTTLKSRIVEGEVSNLPKPRQSETTTLKIPQLALYAGENLYIRFVVKQRKDSPAVPKNTVLSEIQIPLAMPQATRQPLPEYSRQPINIVMDTNESKNMLTVNGNRFSVSFDLGSGEIRSYSFNNVNIFDMAPQLHCWREPIPNDIADNHLVRTWQQYNPNQIQRRMVDIDYRVLDEYSIAIDVMSQYLAIDGSPLIDEKQSYLILSTGDVLLTEDLALLSPNKKPACVGLTMALNKALTTVEWEGLKGESYPDRKGFNVRGIYNDDISNLYHPYASSQESGNRTDTKWVSCKNESVGFFVDMLDTLFDFSIQPKLSSWVADFDYSMSGIGNAASNMGIQPQYLLNSDNYHFVLHFCGYDCEENAARDFCQIKYPQSTSVNLPMPEISADRVRFDAPMKISITVPDKNIQIRYTTDGSDPNEQSPLYKSPITIESTTLIKARSFKKGVLHSFTASQLYSFDYISSVKFQNTPNTPYNSNYSSTLVDGEYGDVNDLSRGWVGFSGNDMVVTLMLSKPVNIDQVQLQFAHVPDAWILAPTAVEVYTSADGVDYSTKDTASLNFDPVSEDMNHSEYLKVSVSVPRNNVRYVKIVARNAGRLPQWHKAKGLKSWILSDEVILKESIH